MDELLRFWNDYTLRTVSMGALILGLGSGALGSFALLRRQSLLGDAVSHAALPGIALAFLLGGGRHPLALLAGAAVAGWVGASIILTITRRSRIDNDGAQALVLSVFFGLGLMLLTVIQGLPDAGKAGLDKYLFGQAAALVEADLWILGSLELAAAALLTLFWKEFKLVTFDPAFAAVQGFSRTFLDALLTVLLVTAIVVGLSSVGVILMSALLVAPAAAARQWTRRLGPMVLLAALFGGAAGLGGAWVSALAPNWPTGPVVVLLLTLINGLSLLLSPHRGLLARFLQARQQGRVFAQDRVLADLGRLARRHDEPGRAHELATLEAMDAEAAGVRPALRALEFRGLVRRHPGGLWGLTEEGFRRSAEEEAHES